MTYHYSVYHRIIAIMLIIVLLWAWYAAPTVYAFGGLVIGGVVVASLAAAAAVTVIALQASGVDVKDAVAAAASAAGKPLQEFVQDNISAYASTTGILPADLALFITKNVFFKPDGTLRFTPSLGQWIIDFGDFLSDQGVDFSASGGGDSLSVTDSAGFDIPGVNFPFYFVTGNRFDYGSGYFQTSVENACCSCFVYDGEYRLIISAPNSSTMTITQYTSSGQYVNRFSTFNTIINNKGVFRRAFTGYQLSNGPVNAATASLTNDSVANCAWLMVYNASSTGASSGFDVWNNDDAVDGFALDPTGLIGEAADQLSGAIANVGDYVQALADVIAGVADPALPVPGVGSIPLDVAPDIPVPVTPAIPADVAVDTPITGENADDSTPYAGTGDYTLPLADFFPFCIPFDLYKMLSLLSASPEAPAFTYQFYDPVSGSSIPIDIDLSAFNSVAAVLRSIETIAFCVGLGFATKKLLFGS